MPCDRGLSAWHIPISIVSGVVEERMDYPPFEHGVMNITHLFLTSW